MPKAADDAKHGNREEDAAPDEELPEGDDKKPVTVVTSLSSDDEDTARDLEALASVDVVQPAEATQDKEADSVKKVSQVVATIEAKSPPKKHDTEAKLVVATKQAVERDRFGQKVRPPRTASTSNVPSNRNGPPMSASNRGGSRGRRMSVAFGGSKALRKITLDSADKMGVQGDTLFDVEYFGTTLSKQAIPYRRKRVLLKVGQINIQVMFHDKNIESWMYKDISNWAINMKMRTFTLHFYSKPQVAFKTEDGAAISDAMEAHARALIKAKKEKTAGYAGNYIVLTDVHMRENHSTVKEFSPSVCTLLQGDLVSVDDMRMLSDGRIRLRVSVHFRDETRIEPAWYKRGTSKVKGWISMTAKDGTMLIESTERTTPLSVEKKKHIEAEAQPTVREPTDEANRHEADHDQNGNGHAKAVESPASTRTPDVALAPEVKESSQLTPAKGASKGKGKGKGKDSKRGDENDAEKAEEQSKAKSKRGKKSAAAGPQRNAGKGVKKNKKNKRKQDEESEDKDDSSSESSGSDDDDDDDDTSNDGKRKKGSKGKGRRGKVANVAKKSKAKGGKQKKKNTRQQESESDDDSDHDDDDSSSEGSDSDSDSETDSEDSDSSSDAGRKATTRGNNTSKRGKGSSASDRKKRIKASKASKKKRRYEAESSWGTPTLAVGALVLTATAASVAMYLYRGKTS